jgi:hypothetical protein
MDMSNPPRATFDPSDPQPRVDEAFACPACEGGQAGIPRLVAAQARWAHETIAHCRCTTCSHTWALKLDLAQTLRVTRISLPGVPAGFPVEDPFGVDSAPHPKGRRLRARCSS